MTETDSAIWPIDRLDEALEHLARSAGLAPHEAPGDGGSESSTVRTMRDADRRLERLAVLHGLEVQVIRTSLRDVEGCLRAAGPALVKIPAGDGFGLLAVVRGGRRRLTVLTPELALARVRTAEVARRLRARTESAITGGLERVLDELRVGRRRRKRVRAALVDKHLGGAAIEAGWIVGRPPSGSFAAALREEHLPRRFLLLGLAHITAFALGLLAWVAIGRGVLTGRLDPGWFVAWALLIFTGIPFRLAETWLEGTLSLGVGALLKRRLLCGALRMHPDEVRPLGAGALLGRVLESEAIETLAMSSGFLGLAALLELALTTWVLAVGAGGSAAVTVLAIAVAAAIVAAVVHLGRARSWATARVAATDDLVERMVGHRTRLAQQDPSRWHAGEDELLEQYLFRSRRMDATALVFQFLPTGYLTVALAAVGPTLLAGNASVGSIAVALGGVLLGTQALGRLCASLGGAATLVVAWQQVKPLFQAAARNDAPGIPTLAPPATGRPVDSDRDAEPTRVLEAEGLTFHHSGSADPVLAECDLTVRAGDRLLLSGPSGGGKSTLASILTGLRNPQAGLLWIRGLDRRTWGAIEWRRRIAAAPQFHENHIFSGSLAFNLLLGRDDTDDPATLREADAVCREIGLGELIDRMPGGLYQNVGETGWQLSHGEQSRVFIARAILQRSDLVVFDESFAALDPGNLRLALDCVFARTRSALVIAHP